MLCSPDNPHQPFLLSSLIASSSSSSSSSFAADALSPQDEEPLGVAVGSLDGALHVAKDFGSGQPRRRQASRRPLLVAVPVAVAVMIIDGAGEHSLLSREGDDGVEGFAAQPVVVDDAPAPMQRFEPPRLVVESPDLELGLHEGYHCPTRRVHELPYVRQHEGERDEGHVDYDHVEEKRRP